MTDSTNTTETDGPEPAADQQTASSSEQTSQDPQKEFTDFVPSLDFDGDIDYANVYRKNEQFFNEEELRYIKHDVQLESLKYFDNNVEFLKSEFEKNKADVDLKSRLDQIIYRMKLNSGVQIVKVFVCGQNDYRNIFVQSP